jgi:hypothetical protein
LSSKRKYIKAKMPTIRDESYLIGGFEKKTRK